MPTIAVVYHSGFGHTQKLAEAVARGAADIADAALVSVDDLPADDAGRWAELDDADAIVFGSPTYMGSVSAGLKAFFERTSGRWGTQRWRDKLAGGFTVSSSPSGDKLNTLQDIAHFAAQHAMLWVPTGVLPTGDADPDSDGALNRLGSYLGPMAQAGPVSPDVEPRAADLRTAEAYGRRIAELATRLAPEPAGA